MCMERREDIFSPQAMHDLRLFSGLRLNLGAS